MFNPFIVTVDLQHCQRAAQSFPGMQGKERLVGWDASISASWNPSWDKLLLPGAQQERGSAKAIELGILQRGRVRDRQICSPEPGYQSCSPGTAERWGVTSSWNVQDCSVPGKLPWPGFPNAVQRQTVQRTPLSCCSYSSGPQCHTQILSKGRNQSAEDTSREALNCSRMGSAQLGASCSFCTPVGKRIHPQLWGSWVMGSCLDC